MNEEKAVARVIHVIEEAGDNKLDFMVGFEYLYLVFDKLTGGLVP